MQITMTSATAARKAQRELLALRVLNVLGQDGEFGPFEGSRAFEIADEMLGQRDELRGYGSLPERTTMETRNTRGAQLKTGDAITCFGRTHRITELKPHPSYARLVPGKSARIADCDTGLSITVSDDSTWQVVV